MTAQTARAAADLTGKRPANTQPKAAQPHTSRKNRKKKTRKHPIRALLLVFVLIGIASFTAGLLTG